MPLAIRSLARVQRALLAWHERDGLRAPWRESRDPYQCLVAAVMAQQTQMSRVLPSYERFVAAFPTVDALAAASAGDVIRVWAGMGYNQRAVRLHRAARAIAAAGWPRDVDGLRRIDGVGPFTAAIVASFAFGAPAACVDTNVRRVLGRLAGEPAIDGARLQRLADASLAAGEPARWNQALMDYGARICTARPNCEECVVAAHCASGAALAAPASLVAEPRVPYGATARQPEPFEASSRYRRGRIIDALRSTPPGGTLRLADLPAMIANGHGAPSSDEVRTLVSALEREGLAVVRRGRVALPE